MAAVRHLFCFNRAVSFRCRLQLPKSCLTPLYRKQISTSTTIKDEAQSTSGLHALSSFFQDVEECKDVLSLVKLTTFIVNNTSVVQEKHFMTILKKCVELNQHNLMIAILLQTKHLSATEYNRLIKNEVWNYVVQETAIIGDDYILSQLGKKLIQGFAMPSQTTFEILCAVYQRRREHHNLANLLPVLAEAAASKRQANKLYIGVLAYLQPFFATKNAKNAY